jgi:hypothetical protein
MVAVANIGLSTLIYFCAEHVCFTLGRLAAKEHSRFGSFVVSKDLGSYVGK